MAIGLNGSGHLPMRLANLAGGTSPSRRRPIHQTRLLDGDELIRLLTVVMILRARRRLIHQPKSAVNTPLRKHQRSSLATGMEGSTSIRKQATRDEPMDGREWVSGRNDAEKNHQRPFQ